MEGLGDGARAGALAGLVSGAVIAIGFYAVFQQALSTVPTSTLSSKVCTFAFQNYSPIIRPNLDEINTIIANGTLFSTPVGCSTVAAALRGAEWDLVLSLVICGAIGGFFFGTLFVATSRVWPERVGIRTRIMTYGLVLLLLWLPLSYIDVFVAGGTLGIRYFFPPSLAIDSGSPLLIATGILGYLSFDYSLGRAHAWLQAQPKY